MNGPENVDIEAFLCHSSGDKEKVRALYRRLVSDGVQCWFDERNLLPGQNWKLEVSKAIRASKYVLACLSRNSISIAGFVHKELRQALDVADEQPEGGVYLIPVRLDECEIPDRLSQWQWVDLFAEDGYERLLRLLKPGIGRQVVINFRWAALMPYGRMLYNALVSRFGEDAVLSDPPGIEPESDAMATEGRKIGRWNVLIVTFVPRPFHIPRAEEKNFELTYDIFCRDIEIAIERNAYILPVLADNAKLPDPMNLPDSIREIVNRRPVRIYRHAADGGVAVAVARIEEAMSVT